VNIKYILFMESEYFWQSDRKRLESVRTPVLARSGLKPRMNADINYHNRVAISGGK